jgi:hypothetical protein
MASMDILNSLVGDWKGDNLLWVTPDQEEPYESKTTARVSRPAQGKFLRFDYTWSEEGEPQDGSILIGQTQDSGALTATWIDSWHNGDQIMLLRGKVDETGSADLYGSYPAPSGPDWGWRIYMEPGGIDSFRLFMYNITPDGAEHLAVEVDYRPAS